MAKMMSRFASVSGNVDMLPAIAGFIEGFTSLNEHASQHPESISVQGQIDVSIVITVDGEEDTWTKHANKFTRKGAMIRFKRTKHSGRCQLVTAVRDDDGVWSFKQELLIQIG